MSNFWDLTVTLTNQFAVWIWEGLTTTVGTAFDFTQNSISALAGTLVSILTLLLYFPIRLFGVVIDLLNEIVTSIATLINTVISMGYGLIDLFTAAFTDTLPSPWIALILAIVLLNIALRVYYFAKDISIAGFKI